MEEWRTSAVIRLAFLHIFQSQSDFDVQPRLRIVELDNI